jgi:hypothetical protein
MNPFVSKLPVKQLCFIRLLALLVATVKTEN